MRLVWASVGAVATMLLSIGRSRTLEAGPGSAILRPPFVPNLCVAARRAWRSVPDVRRNFRVRASPERLDRCVLARPRAADRLPPVAVAGGRRTSATRRLTG